MLLERIEQRLRTRPLPLEVAERGLDHLRCCYRFGFRRSSEQEWIELPIHFQVAERLEAGQDEAELHRILDSLLERSFALRAPAKRIPQEE